MDGIFSERDPEVNRVAPRMLSGCVVGWHFRHEQSLIHIFTTCIAWFNPAFRHTVTQTTVAAGASHTMQYKHHIEANLVIEGRGTVSEVDRPMQSTLLVPTAWLLMRRTSDHY